MTLVSDVQRVSASVEALQKQVETDHSAIARHEEQISGERGLSAAINALSEEVKGLRRALLAAGGGFVLAALTFGLSVLGRI